MKLIIEIPEKEYENICLMSKYGTGVAFYDWVANGTPLEDIVDGIESHKWGNNEGSKEIYNNAIDDVLTYIEEKKWKENKQ